MTTIAYRFGRYTVDVTRACVHRDGIVIALRPKSFALLHYLVAHADRLVTKDELLSALWPASVVTEDSLTRCVSEVRAAIGDREQTAIETVAGRGYVFAEPVVAVAADTCAGVRDAVTVAQAAVATAASPETSPSPSPSTSASPSPGSERPNGAASWRALTGRFGHPRLAAAVASLIALSMLAAVVVWQLRMGQQRVLAPRMTMVVLPFANLGGDPAQASLGDSITEDLTTALSRLHGATVISAGTALTFRNGPIDPRAVGADLDIRYVVQGSVMRTVDGRRISASLVDAQSARTLRSDQFDAATPILPPPESCS